MFRDVDASNQPEPTGPDSSARHRPFADRLADHDREADLPPFRQIDDAKALRALAHPTRVALLEQLTLHGGTLTATQASELVDESPTNCAFHLRTLAKYGYIEQAEGGKGRERPWRLAHMGLGFDDEGAGSEGADGELSLAAGALRQVFVQHHFDRIRAFEAARHTIPAEVREMAGGWDTFWYVTPEEMKDLHARIEELIVLYRDRLDPARRPPGSIPVQAVIHLTPLMESGPTPTAKDEP